MIKVNLQVLEPETECEGDNTWQNQGLKREKTERRRRQVHAWTSLQYTAGKWGKVNDINRVRYTSGKNIMKRCLEINIEN